MEAWKTSLAIDPVPIRAPVEADQIIREVAAETGATLLDLEQTIGAMPNGKLFIDTLHLSDRGAAAVARALEPVIREQLDLPRR
jgi:lysophospholipase L1-like esterase